MADKYTTQLTPEQERDYQQWRASLPSDLQNEGDYDLRGAFLDSVKADGQLHMTDKFKKPNHITFSEESQYSSPEQRGGRWAGSGAPSAFTFWASPENIRQHSANALASYFTANEPKGTLVLPFDYKMPRGR